MEEIRKDPVVGEWVIISAARGKRPSDYNKPNNTNNTTNKEEGEGEEEEEEEKRKRKQGVCPFCLGREQETGAELFAFRDGGSLCSPNWRVRVVHNIYPAVSVDAMAPNALGKEVQGKGNREDEGEQGLYHNSHIPGFGSHEVVIENPHHHIKFTQFSPLNVGEILICFRQRMRILRDDGRFKYVQVFKNQGKAAGASMEHCHSQIIALPIIPHNVEHEIDCAKQYFDRKRSCVFCDILHHDIAEGSRLIGCSMDYVVITPYAPRYPYETWIVPRAHSANFEDINDAQVESLAETLLWILKKIEHLFGNDVSFNYMVRTSPLQGYEGAPFYHWYIRIIPRLITLAGFELGSGCHILPVFPEKSASELREANPPIS